MIGLINLTYVETKDLFFNYSNITMNGLYSENIVVRDDDDIFIPFPYELTNEVPLNVTDKNIIIDSRYEYVLLKEIYKNGLNTLIYNTSRHKVINIYQYFEDIMGLSKLTLSVVKMKKISFILLLIKYVFKKLKIRYDIRYILQNIDNSDFMKLNILANIATISESTKNSNSNIDSKKYNNMKNKVLEFKELNESIAVQKSFIMLFSDEIIRF